MGQRHATVTPPPCGGAQADVRPRVVRSDRQHGQILGFRVTKALEVLEVGGTL